MYNNNEEIRMDCLRLAKEIVLNDRTINVSVDDLNKLILEYSKAYYTFVLDKKLKCSMDE